MRCTLCRGNQKPAFSVPEARWTLYRRMRWIPSGRASRREDGITNRAPVLLGISQEPRKRARGRFSSYRSFQWVDFVQGSTLGGLYTGSAWVCSLSPTVDFIQVVPF